MRRPIRSTEISTSAEDSSVGMRFSKPGDTWVVIGDNGQGGYRGVIGENGKENGNYYFGSKVYLDMRGCRLLKNRPPWLLGTLNSEAFVGY